MAEKVRWSPRPATSAFGNRKVEKAHELQSRIQISLMSMSSWLSELESLDDSLQSLELVGEESSLEASLDEVGADAGIFFASFTVP
jgi:hypothetical protein